VYWLTGFPGKGFAVTALQPSFQTVVAFHGYSRIHNHVESVKIDTAAVLAFSAGYARRGVRWWKFPQAKVVQGAGGVEPEARAILLTGGVYQLPSTIV
jgi:hypothetical protein